MVRASDRGLLAALGVVFAMLMVAIVLLMPTSESSDPPWFVGDAEPSLDATGPAVEPPAFDRIQMFTGSLRGLPDGVATVGVAVHGRVRTRDGAFVAGATIHVVAGAGGEQPSWALPVEGEHRSAGDGFFSLAAELPTPCVLVLHVQHPAYPPATFVREVAAGSTELDAGYLVLDAGAVAEGRVVDPQGQPIPGARVRLVPLMESPQALAPVSESFFAARNAVTDRSGRYRFERIVPGDWMLEAAAAGRLSVRTSGFTLLPGPDNPLDLVVLPPALELRVRVTDPEGRALADAAVRATERRSGRVHLGRLSRPGEFLLDALPDAVLDVEASSPGYRTYLAPGVEAATARELAIRLVRGLAVRGRATDMSGRPVERFSVTVVPDESAGAGADRVEREARSGRRVLLQRMRELAATVDGRTEVRRLLQQENERMAEDVTQREALVGESSDARVLAAMVLGEVPVPTLWPEGAYEVGGLDDTQIQVVFHAPGFAPLWSEPFALAGEDVVVDVEFGAGHALRGVVVDSSGLPVAGARVRAIPRDRGIETAMRTVACGVDVAESAPDGTFVVRGVPAGTWALVATAAGCLPALGEGLLVDADRGGIQLTLRRHGTLEGRVASGFATGPVEVVAVPLPSGGSAVQAFSTTLAADGTYRIEGLDPGPHAVRAFPASSVARSREFVEQARMGLLASDVLVAEGWTTRFDLAALEPPGAAVSGTVHDAGRPARGLVVAVRMLDPAGAQGAALGIVAETALDPEGRFRLTDLPAGDCEVVVQLPRDRVAVLASRPLSLTPGAEPQVAIEVATCQLHGTVMLPDGVDTSGLRARLVRAGGAAQYEVVMTTGSFCFDRVPAGEWQLLVDKPGLRHAMTVRLEAGFRNEVVVDATSAGTRLRVRSPR